MMDGIDWQNGTWTRDHHAVARAALLLCGDWAPVRAYGEILSEKPGELYTPETRAHFDEVDFRALNVEAVLHPEPGTLSPVYKEGPPLEGPADAVKDLKALGIDLAFLANNHIHDFGPIGVRSTRSLIETAGVRTCGTGSSQDDAYKGVAVDIRGTTVAFVNFQEGEEGFYTERAPEVAGWNLDRVCASIREHRKMGRVVIAVPHADREFLPWPAPYIQVAYRNLVKAGAAAVVAHHPHVPRGIEIFKGSPIFYSLGNFAFWQDHEGIFRKLGYMVKLRLSREGIVGWQLVPYRITENRIESLATGTREKFLRRLQSVSGETLAPEAVLAGWNAAIDAISIDSWYGDCTGMDYGMKRMKEHDPVGLARLRTRLSSPSHYTFMVDGITRILDGKHGSSSPELVEMVRLWTGAHDFREI